MKDSELQFDRTCHVLYSKPCKKEILAKIALHYPEAEREAVWEQVQRQYVAFLSDWRTDLGGKKNFHNGAGGTYMKWTSRPSTRTSRSIMNSRPARRRSSQTALTLTVRPHRNDGSQEDAKQEQPADGGLLSYTKKLCLFFKKHPPGELHNQKML